jgi:hypothetical protein
MSINAHFSHYDAIPANDANGTLLAERLLTPTVDLGNPQAAYFRDNDPDYGDSASLIYSVGCHSGLSVIANDIHATASSKYRADFAEAVLKQGGNWIGNTGYGYGDSDLVAYSERLSLLFTEAIGRDIRSGQTYTGPTIGESLVRAKHEYVQNAGPGGFSVFDEKVISQMTLYGLPFIRVRVPNPTAPVGGSFDSLPRSIPGALQGNSGTFTRLITFTNSFTSDNIGDERQPRVISRVEDSFVPGTPFTLTGNDVPLLGRPVLPNLTYDITLKTNPTGLGAQQIPEPRGVRLLRAEILPDIAGFNPHVTTPVTDMVYAAQQDDPQMPALLQEAWQPDQPFTFQRSQHRTSATGVITADTLLVSPVQFRPTNAEAGSLRRFAKMVFEVSYVDPRRASAALQSDDTPPLIGRVTITPVVQQAAPKIGPAADQLLRITARVRDAGGSGVQGVRALYTPNGLRWQAVALTQTSPGSGIYAATIQTPWTGTGIFALVDARDAAGNAAMHTGKGELSPAFSSIFLPLIRR